LKSKTAILRRGSEDSMMDTDQIWWVFGTDLKPFSWDVWCLSQCLIRVMARAEFKFQAEMGIRRKS
jgi:hypothetical protein